MLGLGGLEEEAFGTLLDATRTPLRKFVRPQLTRRGVPSSFDEDVVQEAHVQAFRLRGRFHGSTLDALLSWTKPIATYTTANFARSYRAQRRFASGTQPFWSSIESHSLIAEWDEPSRIVEDEELRALLRGEISQLTPRQREAVSGYYLEDRSAVDVARSLETSEDAVRKLVNRAVEALRERLVGRALF